MNHLAANSDAIVQNQGTGYSSGGSGGNVLGTGTTYIAPPGAQDTTATPFYYGRSVDPVYMFNSCGAADGSPYNPIGQSFHIPSNAQFSGLHGDQFFSVWDQVSNQVLSAYKYNSGTQLIGIGPGPFPAVGYCAMAVYATDKGYQAGSGAGDSLHEAPSALYIRSSEWINGQINHALYLNGSCEALVNNGSGPQTVFPASSSHAAQCADPAGPKPIHGSLFFVDYTDTQIATFASGGMAPWKVAILHAMAHYGGYFGDTNDSAAPGHGDQGMYPTRYEGGEGYLTAGLTYPLQPWLAGQAGISGGVGSNQQLNYWGGVPIPNVVGPNCPTSTCGILQHMHIADPCVPLGLAGQPGGCTSVGTMNNYYVNCTTGLDSNSGSSGSPWKTIGHADAALVLGSGGTTVHVFGTCSSSITTIRNGTPAANIKYISDTALAAHITTSWTMNGNYSEVNGFDWTNPGGTFAILMQAGNHRTIQYNYIHDVNVSACTPNGVIHGTTSPSDHDIINANVIRHFGGCAPNTYQSFHGIYYDGAAVQITNNIISGGTGGWAIQKQYAAVTDCTPGTISNNTIFNNAGGIVINDENSSCGFNNWTVNNNIIVNNGVTGTGGGGGFSFGIDWYRIHGTTILASNNLLYGNLPANFGSFGAVCTPPTSSCPGVNIKTDVGGVTATFINFQVDTNQSPATSYNATNYKLKTGSNGIGGGTTSCASGGMNPCTPVIDAGGTPENSPIDIGRWTFNSSGGTLPPAPTGLTAIVAFLVITLLGSGFWRMIT